MIFLVSAKETNYPGCAIRSRRLRQERDSLGSGGLRRGAGAFPSDSMHIGRIQMLECIPPQKDLPDFCLIFVPC